MTGQSLLFPENLGAALGWMVLHVLWQAAAIGFVTAIALLALRHKPARWRYWLANAALAAILVAALATFAIYYTGSSPAPIGSGAIHDAIASQDAAPYDASPAPPPTSADRELDSASFRAYFDHNLPLIVTIWMLGMCMFLLRLMGNIGYVYYLKSHLNIPVEQYWEDILHRLAQKSGIKKTISLVESALVRSPMVVGYLKPVILFPIGMINRLEPDEAEAILAHELAHILRHDYLFNILQSLVETLFYYHPAVWWLSAKVRHEREIAADDFAIGLTGNAVQYAKALVAVQDMALRPMSISLAFAGSRKSQLMQRVQHILHIHPTKNVSMEKMIGAGAIILVLAGLGFTQAKTMGSLPNLFSKVSLLGAEQSGVWEGKIEGDKVCILFSSRAQGDRWMTEDCFLKSEFSALPTQEAEFTLTRPAGAFMLKGKFEGNDGYGKFKFTADKAFADWISQQGISEVDDEMMWHLFFANADKAYVTSLQKEVPGGQLSGDDLKELAIHGVDTKAIQEYRKLAADLGENDLRLDEIVELKIHDINIDYAKALAKSGFKDLTIQDILNAKIHEVDPDYIKQVNAMGYPGLSFDDLLNFKIHDISPEYIRSLKQAGVDDLSADELVNMSIHDVTPETIAEFKKMGYSDMSSDDIINFSIHDVDAEFVAEMRKEGFTDLSTDELVNLKIHEVEPGYLAEMRKAGLNDLSNDDIVNLRIHDVDADFILAMRKAGFSDFSTDDIINLKIHDVDVDFVDQMYKSGLKDLSIDDIVNCAIHDVNPERIKGFQQIGFKDIDIDAAVNLQIHDVTPEFIQDMRKKGFKNLDLDEYIELKIKSEDREE
jgi:beta-lactamase regulating signal transducer with metallopeptidase domain